VTAIAKYTTVIKVQVQLPEKLHHSSILPFPAHSVITNMHPYNLLLYWDQL